MYQVLIVDDEQAVHQAIQALVDWPAIHAHVPVAAYNGAEALKLMEVYRPEIVFVDMNMPLMNGVEFLEKATESYPNTQFIVVSGYDGFTFTKAAIRYQVLDYLLKPIDQSELEAVLQKAITRLPAPSGSTLRPTDIAAQVRKYIDGHCQLNLSVDALAEHFHFSREYLNRVFRAEYDCAIYEYVQRVRMENACQMLQNPHWQMQDIAEKLGYSNANYFSKAFKKYFGCSPREYREQSHL